MYHIALDMHTHTLASGHAYATLTEMAQAAAQRGLEILGVTEHAAGIPGTCEDIYFLNLSVVPRQLFGVELMLGAEINITDEHGSLSMEDGLIDRLDLRIAGIHAQCYHVGTRAQNTQAVLGAIENPRIDIISHPDDGNCPLDYPALVRAARDHHTLLEINNNALRNPSRLHVRENAATILKLCRAADLPVLLSSDAHFTHDVANLDHALPLLEELAFPPELVLNSDAQAFRRWIGQNRT